MRTTVLNDHQTIAYLPATTSPQIPKPFKGHAAATSPIAFSRSIGGAGHLKEEVIPGPVVKSLHHIHHLYIHEPLGGSTGHFREE